MEDIPQEQLLFSTVVSTAAPSKYCSQARILGLHEKCECYDEEAGRKRAMIRRDLELRSFRESLRSGTKGGTKVTGIWLSASASDDGEWALVA